jgi:peptidyl-prolyl cis-trans isomerase SurA
MGIERDLRRRQGLLDTKSWVVQAKSELFDKNFGEAANQLGEAAERLDTVIKGAKQDESILALRELTERLREVRLELSMGKPVSIKKLDEMRKEMKLESMDDLEKAAQSQGISFEDFKLNLRNQIITQQVIGREVGQRMSIPKEEIQKFYDDHKSEMEQPEQIRLSEILVSTEKKGDADTTDDSQRLAAAEAKAQGLLAQIRKGSSFEDVAKKNSEGPTAAQGGDLGGFKRGTLAKELEDKTFSMKAGEVSDIVRTRQGFVILKVTEHHDAGVPALSEIEGRIQDAIYMRKLQPALRAYLQKLREEAYIDIKTGYVDTGASPNQTKPVETVASDPTAKQLKKKKKFGVF